MLLNIFNLSFFYAYRFNFKHFYGYLYIFFQIHLETLQYELKSINATSYIGIFSSKLMTFECKINAISISIFYGNIIPKDIFYFSFL
jgi:hypothetical protein